MIHVGWKKNYNDAVSKMHIIRLESKEVYVLI